jgi:ABC-type phosphate transport system auxiliary subunit
MSVHPADRELQEIRTHLAALRGEQHRLALATQASERQTQAVLAELARLRSDLRPADERLELIVREEAMRLWILNTLHLGLGVVTLTFLVIHALAR